MCSAKVLLVLMEHSIDVIKNVKVLPCLVYYLLMNCHYYHHCYYYRHCKNTICRCPKILKTNKKNLPNFVQKSNAVRLKTLNTFFQSPKKEISVNDLQET